MLVVDPAKRISVAQIKQHRWMLADPTAAHMTLSHSLTDYNSNLGDYSEPVLGIMNTLGIDRQKTIEVIKQKKKKSIHHIGILNCFDHFVDILAKDKIKISSVYIFSPCKAAATITSLPSITFCWRESESIVPSSWAVSVEPGARDPEASLIPPAQRWALPF